MAAPRCTWCGLRLTPPSTDAWRCGVLLYLHVPKTGGTSVVNFLHQSTRRSSEAWQHLTVSAETPYSAILARVRQRQQHKQGNR